MSRQNDLLKNLHKIMREDPYIIAVMKSAGVELSSLDERMQMIEREFLFSTMSPQMIEFMEALLQYKAQSKSLEGKRIELSSRWKASGKCDVELLQAIANTWRDGAVEVRFEKAVLQIKFVSVVGIPSDLDSLKFVISEAKPAHLPIKFGFKFRTWGMLKLIKWSDIDGKVTWKELREKEGII